MVKTMESEEERVTELWLKKHLDEEKVFELWLKTICMTQFKETIVE